jgi:flavin-dependent dehydrogenase
MAETGARPPAHRYDVAIVGARCAGAALAQRLAFAGLSVVLLDSAKLPSDQPNSTHLVQPPGMRDLDALGVGAAVRELSPALRAVRLSYGGSEARFPYEGAAHCLRRDKLDALLMQAALDAGAELRAESKVIDLMRDQAGAVTGVVVQRSGQPAERIAAGLVVGADGRNSTVAKLVSAKEYIAYDGPRAVYWGYWPRPAGWEKHELYNTFEGDEAHTIFPTDGDMLLISSVPPLERAETWRKDHRTFYIESVRSYPTIASAVEGLEPVGRVHGVLKPRYFFRTSAGPGWALIGDAGHHKDFVAGLGISDALSDAREVAGAILDGSPDALARWWRRRDVERIELFHWARELGRAGTTDDVLRMGIGGLGRSGMPLQGNFNEVLAGRLPAYSLVPELKAIGWIAASVAKGDVSPLLAMPGFLLRRTQARRAKRRARACLRELGRG